MASINSGASRGFERAFDARILGVVTPPHGYEWTYAQPGSTFPDSLRRHGVHTSGRVHKYSRPIGPEAPEAPRRRFYVASLAGEHLPGEFTTLEEAYAAVLDAIERS